MRANVDNIDFDRAKVLESELRHDVMAHVKLFGEAAPLAAGCIHLGATSQFVVCNTELMLIREALSVLGRKLAHLLHLLGNVADQYADLATLGFTHLQPAQPTTVGKRAALWGQVCSCAGLALPQSCRAD